MTDGGASHHERERIVRSAGGQTAQNFIAAFVGETQFPTQAVAISISEHRRRRRRQLQAIAVALNKSATAHMSLDQSFGFELGVRIGNGSAMNAEYNGKFAAGGDAGPGTKITRTKHGAKLIRQLN